jgi:hypothetical protein
MPLFALREHVVLDVAKALPDVERKRITVGLERARHYVIDARRPYNSRIGDWLENAVTEHARLPFHAIIARRNPKRAECVLTAQDIDGAHRLFVTERDCKVARSATSLALIAAPLLIYSKRILFVDGYYDPSDRRYQKALKAYLATAVKKGSADKSVEFHFADHQRKPTSEAIEREAKYWFPGIIPDGITVALFRWKRRDNGEEFHARYILSELGGIRFDEGLAEGRVGELSDVALMDPALVENRRKAFGRDSNVFQLVEPILQIAANGYVERL